MMTPAERYTMTLEERSIWKAVYADCFAKHENAKQAFNVADTAVLELRAMFENNGLGTW